MKQQLLFLLMMFGVSLEVLERTLFWPGASQMLVRIGIIVLAPYTNAKSDMCPALQLVSKEERMPSLLSLRSKRGTGVLGS